eukprot:scaffold3826_cov407-Prasinococcus_capsulatus_cf.AAC.23
MVALAVTWCLRSLHSLCERLGYEAQVDLKGGWAGCTAGTSSFIVAQSSPRLRGHGASSR